MLEHKRTTPIFALLGAVVLMAVSAPAFAQNTTDAATPAAATATTDASNTAAPSDASGGVSNGGAQDAPTSIKGAGKMTPVQMFL
jgi:biopolymer transport protein ExbB